MERSQPASSNLMDVHNRLVADILTRFRTLMMLATVQAEGEGNSANPEAIAVTGISMKMEFDGLYSSIKELLTLSRSIKELWVFGPLGQEDPDRKTKIEQIERDVARVSDLLTQMESSGMRELAEKNGGEWRPVVKDEAEIETAAAPPLPVSVPTSVPQDRGAVGTADGVMNGTSGTPGVANGAANV